MGEKKNIYCRRSMRERARRSENSVIFSQWRRLYQTSYREATHFPSAARQLSDWAATARNMYLGFSLGISADIMRRWLFLITPNACGPSPTAQLASLWHTFHRLGVYVCMSKRERENSVFPRGTGQTTFFNSSIYIMSGIRYAPQLENAGNFESVSLSRFSLFQCIYI